MENKVLNETQHKDELDLREFFGILWSGRKKIFAITAAFAIVSVIYALSLPNQYKATAILSPAQSDSSDLSGALGQMGGLASLAGVSLGSSESTEAQIAQEIMQSWSFIENFVSENNIEIEVYASEGWSRDSNELKIDPELYDLETKTWLVKNINSGELGKPSSWELYQSFSERLSVSEDIELGLVTLSIEHYSPYIAKQWLDLYIAAINTHMQERQVSKATNNMNYLQAQIEKTAIAEMRDIFYKLVEEQVKNKMLAEASPDYALVVISPSMLPEVKSQPSRAIICIIGTLFGILLSMFLVLVIHYAKRSE